MCVLISNRKGVLPCQVRKRCVCVLTPNRKGVLPCQVRERCVCFTSNRKGVLKCDYTHLYPGDLWDSLGQTQVSSLERCPYFRGSLYTSLCSWDNRHCPQ